MHEEVEKTAEQREAYEPPMVAEVGTFADLTRGSAYLLYDADTGNGYTS
ncbi:lasso RiPP family leader peptide-containing protein [Fodinicola acaciae]|nr:lasso RiPP family leader peptide-containing protein [Fodinicola acaciae]